MKRRVSFMLSCTAMIFFLSSCANNQERSNAGADDTTVVANDATSASTIVTTPQHMLIVTHKVTDFAKWKASYDSHDSMRLAHGIHNYVIARGVEDSNIVMVATKADDVDKAKTFIKNPSLKQAMQKGGVLGTPDISLTTSVFQDTASLGPDVIRSRTSFTVKDWDTWKTTFESNRQTRLDNGVADRVYGYDVDDNHKINLVTALTDTAKARAFWNSDLLKQQRTASGVTSQPVRFLFRDVERY